ncbi:MAG: type IV secretory system conjugative DNA transfer family protein [Verrucomicrobiota bacterium]
MSLLKKISLRLDEMLHLSGATSRPSNEGRDMVSNSSPNRFSNGDPADIQPVKTKRFRHPKEESYVRSGDYGKLRFRFKNPEDQFITEEGDAFDMTDLYTHAIVFGESGSGKTSFVLNQVYEEFFRSTHLRDSADREERKIAGLVIEAKGDFAPKSWDLALKYGRAEDIIFFGPNHLDNVYDPFGDDSELPQQMADKMQAVMDAFSGGQKSTDPFWPAASRKLFTQIFHLHRKLKENGSQNLMPMSFDLLNLLLLDKGQPRNQGEIDQKAKLFQETYEKFNTQMDKAKSIAMRLSVECNPLSDKVETAIRRAQEELKEIDANIQATEEPTAEWRKQVAEQRENTQRKLAYAGNIKNILSCEESEARERMVPRLEKLQKDISGMGTATDDLERGRYYDNIVDNGSEICEIVHARIGLVGDALNVDHPENLLRIKNMLLDLTDALEKIGQIGDQLANWQAPEPQQGMLKTMLMEYEQIVVSQGGNPAVDPICAYFYEEHLNPANDKTSGSVTMTASNLVNLFVHHPFNKIFSPKGANFNMVKVIDEGKIVCLDIPQAKYGVIMNIASLIMKVDFYRAVLSRKVTYIKDAQTGTERLINQDRPLTYFCDEFASIASTGDTTGEAGFLDKCREYKCACVLAVQSKPMLLKKLKEPEVDAILTNCGIKIFMRNTDQKTTEMASKVLGNEIKVNPYSTQSMTEHAMMLDKPIGSRGFSSSYQRQPRFDPTKFAELKNGEAIVKLNPRFGRNQTKKVAFLLHIIKSIDDGKLKPFPIVT